MSDITTYNQLIEVMMNEDEESLTDFLLVESELDEVVGALEGDTTIFNYIMLFEEFLEQHDIYLFKGWDKASVIGRPTVEKFWITVNVLISDDTDIRGAKRVKTAMGQGDVTAQKVDGGRVITFLILKQDLDQIEETNKERIEKLSIAALENL